MTIKLIERPSGAGSVYRKDGDLVGQAEYDLRVYREYRDASTMGDPATIPGLDQIEGTISGLDNFALLNESARLTLHLDDGRRLDFQVGGIDGRVSPNSGLYKPS